MKIRVHISSPSVSLDREFVGKSADEVVTSIQQFAASKTGFAKGLLIKALPAKQFAVETVKKYNEAMSKSLPLPASCQDFIEIGVREGFVTVLES